MIWDCVPVNDELDLVECRLMELEDVPNLVHVMVEADVTHQGRPKPYHLSENSDRFNKWAERVIIVRATNLPTVADAPDAWAREQAQREHCAAGLIEGGVESGDVVLHGDLDEIPRSLVVRNLHPRGMVALEMTGLFWSCRWRYPYPWLGTVATTAGRVTSFNAMRDARNTAPRIPDAGWHLSWLGGADRARTKLASFCHPEVAARVDEGINNGRFLNEGWHVDGAQMTRCEVDDTYPRYVRDELCPASWVL